MIRRVELLIIALVEAPNLAGIALAKETLSNGGGPITAGFLLLGGLGTFMAILTGMIVQRYYERTQVKTA